MIMEKAGVGSVAHMIAEASARLVAADVEGARRDARLLYLQASSWTMADLIAREQDEAPTSDVAERYQALIDRRAAGEPVSRISGRREFWGLEFCITPDVLDPRPDTETLVQAGLDLISAEVAPYVLDLGTGTGCVLLAILSERADARGVGLDVSPEALKVARRNAQDLGLSAQADFMQSSWFAALEPERAFSLIVSNPPYIPHQDIVGLDQEVKAHDPMLALDGGADGLDPYRHIVAHAPAYLKAGGALAVEVGIGQAEDVAAMMQQYSYVSIEFSKDLSGVKRCVYGRAPSV